MHVKQSGNFNWVQTLSVIHEFHNKPYIACPNKKRNINILVIYSIQNDKEFVKNT